MKVLIVDDHNETACTLAQRFNVMGHDADYLTDVKKVLKLFNTEKISTYDHILLDVYLNGVNGVDLYEDLSTKQLGDKVIFISGCDEKSQIFNKVLNLNIPIVVKMFSAKDLVKSLEDGKIKEWSDSLLERRGIKRSCIAIK